MISAKVQATLNRHKLNYEKLLRELEVAKANTIGRPLQAIRIVELVEDLEDRDVTISELRRRAQLHTNEIDRLNKQPKPLWWYAWAWIWRKLA